MLLLKEESRLRIACEEGAAHVSDDLHRVPALFLIASNPELPSLIEYAALSGRHCGSIERKTLSRRDQEQGDYGMHSHGRANSGNTRRCVYKRRTGSLG